MPRPRSHARALLLTASSLVASAPAAARAATYVDEPALGRSVVGVDVFGGAPIGSSEPRPSAVGGGGTEVRYGYAWESRWSVHGTFGAARWSGKNALGDALGDRDATIGEGYGGVTARWVWLDAGLSPFVEGSVLGEVLRVRGVVAHDALGLGLGGAVGVRWRDAPWDGWIAFDARTSRFDGDVSLTRLALAVGATLDVR